MKNEEFDDNDELDDFISENAEELTFSRDKIADSEEVTADKTAKHFLFLQNEVAAIIFTVLIVLIAVVFFFFCFR